MPKRKSRKSQAKTKPEDHPKFIKEPNVLKKLFEDPEVWAHLRLPNVDKRIIAQIRHLNGLKPNNSLQRTQAWQKIQKVTLARLLILKEQEVKLKTAKRLKRKMKHEMVRRRTGQTSGKARAVEWEKMAHLGKDVEKSLALSMKIRAFNIFYLIAGGVPWKNMRVQSLLEEFSLFREALWGIKNPHQLFKTRH